jgi:hypothetical protein
MKYLNSHFKPSEINDLPWLYEENHEIVQDLFDGDLNTGKWMLFYDRKYMDNKWLEINKLYRNKELDGVIKMKCSTFYDNPRASGKSGVIILYCNNSDNEYRIKDIGKNIMKLLSYNKTIYYKTDSQTRLGTIATGQTNNHLYKIDPQELYSIIDSDDE